MSRLLNYFFKGLIVVAPVFITLYVCWVIFTSIDSWIRLPIPGAGFVASIVLIGNLLSLIFVPVGLVLALRS